MATTPNKPIDVAADENAPTDSCLVLFLEPTTERFPMVVMSSHAKKHTHINTREAWIQEMSGPMDAAIRFAAEDLGIELEPHEGGFDFACAPITHSRRCIGVCRHAEYHNQKARIQIDTSIEDPFLMCHILLHEMVHAFLPSDGHRGRFPKIMRRLNSVGKMTASNYGWEQMAWFDMLLDNIRPWKEVHPKPFKVTPRGQRGKGSRLIKCECPYADCGAIMRVSQKVLTMAQDRAINIRLQMPNECNCIEWHCDHWTGEGFVCCPACGVREMGVHY
jgi:hypothetical protein